MRFTEYELKIFERYAEENPGLVLKVVNLAGQEFVISGDIVCDNRRFYGDSSALTEFRLTLDIGQRQSKDGLSLNNILRKDEGASLNVSLYTEPKKGEERTLFIREIATDKGMFVWRNIYDDELQAFLDYTQSRQQGEVEEKYMTGDAKRLMGFLGKPCVVYGEHVIVIGVREFSTARGYERYLNCITSEGEREICVTPDAVKLDKKALKRVPPVDSAEGFF